MTHSNKHKKTREHYAEMARARNHELISISNEVTPSQGNLTILCKTCDKQFTTSAKSYSNARVTGCPSCKSIKAQNQKGAKKVKSSEESEKLQQMQKAKKQKELDERLKKREKFVNIRSLETLKFYLKNENNTYSDFILSKLANPTRQSIETQLHHIIPRHAGGPNAAWNLIVLTREEHIKAHLLRYQVYKEFGDYNFLSTVGAIGISVEPNPEFEEILQKQRQQGSKTQKEMGIGIFEEGAAKRGGETSKKVMELLTPEQRRILDKRHQVQMSGAVWEVLYRGSEFVHNRTGTRVILKPEETLTLTQLKDILAAALPEGDIDRERLENTKRPSNVTSAISKMIQERKGRPSAYGWRLVKNQEI